MKPIGKKLLFVLSSINLLNGMESPMKVNVIDTLGEVYADENIIRKERHPKKINSYAHDLNKALIMHNIEKIKSIIDEAKENLTNEQQKQLLLSNPFIAQAALCEARDKIIKDDVSVSLLLAWGMSYDNELNSQERFGFLTQRVGPSFSSPLGTIIDNCCWICLDEKDWIGNKITLEEQIAPILKCANDLLTYEDFLIFANDGFSYLKANCAKQKAKTDKRATTTLNWFLLSLKSLSIDAFVELIKKNTWVIPILSKEQLIKIFSKNSEKLTRTIDPQNQNNTKTPDKLDTKEIPALPVA